MQTVVTVERLVMELAKSLIRMESRLFTSEILVKKLDPCMTVVTADGHEILVVQLAESLVVMNS